MLWYFWLTKMHHEVTGTLVALVKSCVFWRMIMRPYECCILLTSNPKRAKGSGMFGNERYFFKTHLRISFCHFILFSRFPANFHVAVRCA